MQIGSLQQAFSDQPIRWCCIDRLSWQDFTGAIRQICDPSCEIVVGRWDNFRVVARNAVREPSARSECWRRPLLLRLSRTN